MKRLAILAALFIAAFPLAAQSPAWLTISVQGQTVVGLPAGSVVRYGDAKNNKWTAPLTIAAAQASAFAVVSASFPGGDPDPGVFKVLQVQIAIPATATPSPTPATSITIPYNGTCSTTLGADGTLTISLSSVTP